MGGTIMLIVQKFGGSSLADPERLRRAAGISLEARRRGNRVVTVVSAAGDSTDELLERARALTKHPDPRELDALAATGEQQSAALMAICIQSLGGKARSLTGWQAGILSDPRHGDARICLVVPARIEQALAAGEIAVVTGFQAVSPQGEITTLGRGGSDTSAVTLAAALGAERCEIYTDVDGIYTADPRLVPGAKLLEQIDFRDMLALAEAGSQVLHPRSVALAEANGTEIRLLSSFRPGPGSVVRNLAEQERPPIAGVTRDAEKSVVTAVGRAVGPDMLEHLEEVLKENGIVPLRGEAGGGRLQIQVAPDRLLPALALTHRTLFEG